MKFCVSQYNAKGLSQTSKLPDFVYLCDSTLRDGEQANVKYTSDEKIEIARRLDDAGISEIQVGSLRSPQYIAEAKAICSLGLRARIEIMTRATMPAWHDEVTQAVDFGADVVHSMLPLSRWLRGAYGQELDDEALLERAAAVIGTAHERGAKFVNISLLDATRTGEEYLKKTVQTLALAGAERICLADTAGCATPAGITYLVERCGNWLDEVKKRDDVILRLHLHNDFGLVMANCAAAVSAGANTLDCCVNGTGKRAGNADTVQLAVSLKALYGIDTGVDLTKLFELAKFVEKTAGVPIPANMPFTGELAFADDSESHIRGLMKNTFAFQAIDPENDWGNPRRILIGKNSGLSALELKLSQLGLPLLTKEKMQQLLDQCHSRAQELPKGAWLTDEEIVKLSAEIA